MRKFSLMFCARASLSCVWYSRSLHFVTTCVGSEQLSQRDELFQGIANEKLGTELWYHLCTLSGFICITRGNFDRRGKPRAKELVASVLTFFKLERLFHG